LSILLICVEKIQVSLKSDKNNGTLREDQYIQGGARNVIPLIVHVTHFYYYKNI